MNKFLKAVEQMRIYQKQYFKTRNQGALRQSIEAEKVVDKMIEDKKKEAE